MSFPSGDNGQARAEGPGGLSRPELPVLVLMPGMDGTGLGFRLLLAELPSGLRTVVVSYPQDRPQTLDRLVEAAAIQVPRDRPVAVLAESFSGPVAAAMLARHRFNLAGVIFCATFARPPHSTIKGLIRMAAYILLLRLPAPRFIRRRFGEGRTRSRELEELFKEVGRKARPEVFRGRLRLIRRVDVTAELGRIAAPCLYLQAGKDSLVTPVNLEPFLAGLPGLKVARVEGPHFILQARPRECAGIILEFLRSLPAAGPAHKLQSNK